MSRVGNGTNAGHRTAFMWSSVFAVIEQHGQVQVLLPDGFRVQCNERFEQCAKNMEDARKEPEPPLIVHAAPKHHQPKVFPFTKGDRVFRKGYPNAFGTVTDIDPSDVEDVCVAWDDIGERGFWLQENELTHAAADDDPKREGIVVGSDVVPLWARPEDFSRDSKMSIGRVMSISDDREAATVAWQEGMAPEMVAHPFTLLRRPTDEERRIARERHERRAMEKTHTAATVPPTPVLESFLASRPPTFLVGERVRHTQALGEQIGTVLDDPEAAARGMVAVQWDNREMPNAPGAKSREHPSALSRTTHRQGVGGGEPPTESSSGT